MGAVEVSREGGFLQRSVFGGAARVKDPIHSGTTSLGMLRGVKEELAGGMASGLASMRALYRGPRSAPVVVRVFSPKLRDRLRMYM